MLLTVFCAPRDRSETTFALEVSPELELRDFVALCELESGIPAGEIQISYAEQPLRDLTRALGNYGLKDGDVVVLRQAERRQAAQPPAFPGLPRIDFSSISVPGTSSNQHSSRHPQPPSAAQTPPVTSPASSPQGLDNPSLLRDMLLANPHELSLLKERNPPLAEALLSGDLERFTKVLVEQQQDRARREQERIRLLTADPFDLEAQAKIEEDIRQHNIEENMTIAMEEAPESFGQVVMLYINCKVNGHPVKAFVDSGAQMTIMSQACAERCNIMRLVDRRWAGIAKGVGTQKIIGRVHLAQVQIEGDFLPCSFSILEDQPMDMLLGLDMLKRHQCSIDLKKSVLLIGTTGTETRFLPEAELPDCARLAYGPEVREDARPEEIADQELAEALHRSIQDSDTADGKSTSPQSPPLSLCTPFNTATSSSATSRNRSFTLDRSKSAPASIHHHLPPEASFSPPQTWGETKSHPSVTQDETEYHPPHAEEIPASCPLQPESSQNPALGLADAFTPQSQPETHSTSPANQATEALIPPILPAQEPLSSTVSKDNEVTNLVTCEESVNQLDASVWEDVALEERKETASPFTNLNTRPQNGALLEEVDMTESTDAKIIGSNIVDQLQDKEQDSIVNNAANSQVDQLNPVSELTLYHNLTGSASSLEQPLVHSDFEEDMDARPASKKTTPSERDEREGDNIPSLAQALKELHQLLMSNAHAQACGRSPPSASHTTASGQDTEGVDPEPISEDFANLNPTVYSSSSHTATTNETNFAKSEHAALAEDGTIDVPTINPQGQEENQTNGVENISIEQDMTQSPHIPEGNRVVGNEGGHVSETGEASPLHGFEFREASESQQGQGYADRRTSGADPPNLAEGSQQRPLSVAVDSSADSSSLVPVASSQPSTQATRSAPLLFADSIQPSALTSRGQYPAEHIQRIQAAGFSSHEAAEALDRAEGSVELALLVLLARKITVPT